MTNCDISTTLCLNFVTDKPKIQSFSVLVWILVWMSWNLVHGLIFRCRLHIWILKYQYKYTYISEKKADFLLHFGLFSRKHSKMWLPGQQGKVNLPFLVSKHHLYRVPQKKFLCLILSKLKMTVSTQSVYIFSESPLINLRLGIKQSKIGWNFAEQWLLKARISGPTGDRCPHFFQKCTNLKQPYHFIKVHWSIKNFLKLKET